MIAKMSAFFDKADYEKGRSLKTDIDNEISVKDTNSPMNGDIIEKAIKDTIANGKVGALNVDPNYLDFVALECELNFYDNKDTVFNNLNLFLDRQTKRARRYNTRIFLPTF